MATIKKSTNPNSRKPWTVRYSADGKQSERSFVTKKEATDYGAKVEHDKRAKGPRWVFTYATRLDHNDERVLVTCGAKRI